MIIDDAHLTEAIRRQWPDRVASLKELLTQRIDHLQHLADERQVAVKMALELNTRETQRRLDLLNGEAERLRAMQATYLPREIYGHNYAELSKAVNDLDRRAANQQGRAQVMAAVVSVGVSVVVGLLFIVITRVLH